MLKEKKIILSIAAGALALSAAAGFGIYMTLDSISLKEAEAETKRQDIAAARKKVDATAGLEDKVIVLREGMATLTSVLPNTKEVEEFVTRLSETRGEAGVRISDLAQKSGAKSKEKVFDKLGYGIKLRGTIWQFLEFLHRVESFKRFVMVPKLRISGGSRGKLGEESSHEFDIEVETYTYNPARGGKPEPIPNYEKRRDGLAEEIAQSIETIETPTIEWLGSRGRRDIFADPRLPAAQAEGGGGLPLEAQQALVAKLKKSVEELTTLTAELRASSNFLRRFEIRHEIEQKMPPLEIDVTQAEKEGHITYPLLVRSFRNDVCDALANVKKTLASAPEEQGPSTKDLQEVISRIRQSLATGRVRDAIESARPILEKTGPAEKDPARIALVAELRKLEGEARVAEVFERKNVQIGGVIVDPRRKVAVVNGRAIEPGDPIDDDLVVADISEDGVTFVLQNVLITKKW